MRVNIEDDLRTSGRLSKLARVMHWSEREALGALVMFYRATQDAEIVEATEDELVDLCSVDHDDEAAARAFVRGLLSSRLASAQQDKIVIHGNAAQVDRVKTLRSNASKGGRARQESLRKSKPVAKQMPSKCQADRSPPSPGSLLPPPAPLVTTEDHETISHDPARRKNSPSAPPASGSRYRDAVACWFENYEQVYHRKPPWGDVQGKQLQNAIRKCEPGEELELVQQFFHGPYPDSTNAGHPLSTGFASFAMRLDMLRADLANPQRRAKAAAMASKLKQAEKGAAIESAVEEAKRLFAAQNGGKNGNG